MAWVTVKSLTVDCDEKSFQDAIAVWIQRPNVSSKIISCASIDPVTSDFLSKRPILAETLYKTCNFRVDSETAIDNSLEKCHAVEQQLFMRTLFPKNPLVHSTLSELVIKEDCLVTFIPLCDDMYVEGKEILYKIEIMPDLQSLSLHSEGPSKRYHVQLSVFGNTESKSSKTCAPTKQWLSEKLLANLVKWTEISEKSVKKLPASLSLIPQQHYAPLYQSLKDKYGKKLAAMWQEATDPQKYVYEDIAIATYLIILWRQERKLKNIEKLQTFIDLGCGNGLLVHILNSEGHSGVGVDVRRRKIWDLYPKSTILRESAIDPTSDNLFLEYDWLLGNHSDELTPWLPVLAARSGYNVRYWVLPCCFYDFFAKYERCRSTMSQYNDYLNFVEDVAVRCGFDVKIDVMRIPSTKRVCHVGMAKLYSQENHDAVVQDIERYIEERRLSNATFEARDKVEKVRNCTKMSRDLQNEIVDIIVSKLLQTKNFVSLMLPTGVRHINGEAKPDFLQLENEAPVSISSGNRFHENSQDIQYSTVNIDEVSSRNMSSTYACITADRLEDDSTHILLSGQVDPPAELRDAIVCEPVSNNTFKHDSSSQHRRTAKNTRLWNRGGVMSLEEAVSLLSEGMRTRMKNECGGLQTLLRNHHQIFDIVGGKVQLRDWTTLTSRARRKRRGHLKDFVVKKRVCWFFVNHPDGCPREDEYCPFLHDFSGDIK